MGKILIVLWEFQSHEILLSWYLLVCILFLIHCNMVSMGFPIMHGIPASVFVSFCYFSDTQCLNHINAMFSFFISRSCQMHWLTVVYHIKFLLDEDLCIISSCDSHLLGSLASMASLDSSVSSLEISKLTLRSKCEHILRIFRLGTLLPILENFHWKLKSYVFLIYIYIYITTISLSITNIKYSSYLH